MPKQVPDAEEAVEDDTVYAPEPEAVARENFPEGVFVGVGVESTHIDGVEYKVDPETGQVTGKAKR